MNTSPSSRVTSKPCARPYSGSDTKGWNESQSTSLSLGDSHSLTSGRSGNEGPGGVGYGFSNSSTSGHSVGLTSAHTSGRSGSQSKGYAESIHKRPLVAPEEVGRLFGDRSKPMALVMASGWNPLVVRRLEYYHAKNWRGLYDRHRDHPAPVTLATLPVVLAEEERIRREAVERREREQKQEAIKRQEDAWQKVLERARNRDKRREWLYAEQQRRERQELIDTLLAYLVDFGTCAAILLGGAAGIFAVRMLMAIFG